MSGIISRDDVAQHYSQRFNELIQKNPNKSLAASSTGSLSGKSINGHITNGTLTTHQFYNKNSNQDLRLQAENTHSNQLLAESSSTYTGASDSSVFKKPLPVKRLNYRPHIERRFEILFDGFRSFEDKTTIKFTLTTLETLLYTLKRIPAQPVNPVQLMDHISNLVKEEYFSKRVPKSICGSSVILDQASSIDQYTGNSERSIQLDKPSGIAPLLGTRVVLQDITQSSIHRRELNGPPQGLTNSEYSSISRMGLPSFHQQETSVRSEAASHRGRHSPLMLPETLTGSTFNLFSDSEIARKRDEAAASQEESHSVTVISKKSNKTLVKSTPKPPVNSSKVRKITKATGAAVKKPPNGRSKLSVPVPENCTFDNGNKNISLLNGTANGISRSGRILKPPVKYWNSKGDELCCGISDESEFNESMTLRNRKVLDKKKTPPVRGNKTYNSALPDVPENDVSKPSTTKKARGRPPGKENVVAEKKKPLKKPTDTPVAKSISMKGKTIKKKEEVTNQKTEKALKKSASKRKSKESSDIISKKKKVEDPVASDIEDEDIFGAISYKKPKHQNLKAAFSPTAALLSAKKAAGEAQGKATPPCKSIGDLLPNESIHSTMSAAKEVPKPNEAIKRATKKVEKVKNAPAQSKAKTQVHSRKEDCQLNNLIEATKSSYYVANPMCSATLTVFRGNEKESDVSDMEQDDDDDDDDDDYDLM